MHEPREAEVVLGVCEVFSLLPALPVVYMQMKKSVLLCGTLFIMVAVTGLTVTLPGTPEGPCPEAQHIFIKTKKASHCVEHFSCLVAVTGLEPVTFRV